MKKPKIESSKDLTKENLESFAAHSMNKPKSLPKHTPTPLEVVDFSADYGIMKSGSKSKLIGRIRKGADAAFIIRAVNNHEELVEALESDHASMLQFRNGISLVQHREKSPECKTCLLLKAEGRE